MGAIAHDTAPEPDVLRPATKEDLLRRADLVSRSEEHAALAWALGRLAQDATVQDLLALPVVAAAIKQAADSERDACRQWAAQAEAAEDPLLARSLTQLTEALDLASERAEAVYAQAQGFADLDEAETG
jgi:hypothetical protein